MGGNFNGEKNEAGGIYPDWNTGTIFNRWSFPCSFSVSGELFAVGLFAPVNESVFEHVKMVALPIFLWWGLFYLFRRRGLRRDAWFSTALLAMFTGTISIPLLYYFYTEAFGIESLVMDALILLISVGLGQLLGRHYYKNGKGIDYRLALALMVIVILLLLVLLSYHQSSLFQNPMDGSYGIPTM